MKTNDISLRAPEPDDLGIMYLFENNTDVWLYSETSRPYSKYTLAEYIKTAHDDIYTTRQLRFVIEKNNIPGASKAIGFVDLYDFDPLHRRAGVGILIGDESERKKGYASQALHLIAEYAFGVLNLHQLFCIIESSNDGSMHLFKKAGYRQAAKLDDWLLQKGEWRSAVMMQHFSTSG
jgi:diamine N-acetyltransferase